MTLHDHWKHQTTTLMTWPAANASQRERSCSPNRRGRSRSPNTRRSFSPRDRSRSRHRPRRSRSPVTGQGTSGGGPGSAYGGSQHRSYEDRSAHREQAMSNIRETSQQDRRVYVGNLSYDVKWHHLKDFMRQGMFAYKDLQLEKSRTKLPTS